MKWMSCGAKRNATKPYPRPPATGRPISPCSRRSRPLARAQSCGCRRRKARRAGRSPRGRSLRQDAIRRRRRRQRVHGRGVLARTPTAPAASTRTPTTKRGSPRCRTWGLATCNPLALPRPCSRSGAPAVRPKDWRRLQEAEGGGAAAAPARLVEATATAVSATAAPATYAERGRGWGEGPVGNDSSPGRHCHSTLSLTVIGCHS
jgi:hypothetical protein